MRLTGHALPATPVSPRLPPLSSLSACPALCCRHMPAALHCTELHYSLHAADLRGPRRLLQPRAPAMTVTTSLLHSATRPGRVSKPSSPCLTPTDCLLTAVKNKTPKTPKTPYAHAAPHHSACSGLAATTALTVPFFPLALTHPVVAELSTGPSCLLPAPSPRSQTTVQALCAQIALLYPICCLPSFLPSFVPFFFHNTTTPGCQGNCQARRGHRIDCLVSTTSLVLPHSPHPPSPLPSSEIIHRPPSALLVATQALQTTARIHPLPLHHT